MHLSFDNSTAMYQDLKNLTPWRESNPGSSVMEADAMTTMPRRKGENNFFPSWLSLEKMGEKSSIFKKHYSCSLKDKQQSIMYSVSFEGFRYEQYQQYIHMCVERVNFLCTKSNS
jgi:hypothetical protein